MTSPTLFDAPQAAGAEVTKPDPKLAAYKRKFLAAGGCLLMVDGDPDEYVAGFMRSGQKSETAARATRYVLPHEFDEFCRRLLAQAEVTT